MVNNFGNFEEKVFLKRPVLKEILLKHGQQTLLKYLDVFFAPKLNTDKSIKAEFISALTEEVLEVLGPETAARVAAQLNENYFVSTADHLGPLSHPFFLNSNMLAGLGCVNRLTDWVVLACSNISLNNSSYPRGLQFHSEKNKNLVLNSFPFFSQKFVHRPIYNLPAYAGQKSRGLESFLKTRLTDSSYNEQINLVSNIYNSDEVFKFTKYSQQITLTNQQIFKEFFPKNTQALNLVYLNQESLTARLLVKHLEKETNIHKLLFNKDIRASAIRLFEGIPGAFSQASSKGSFLFWGYNQNSGLRERLVLKNNSLASEDSAYVLPLTPLAVKNALEQGLIIPSMLLNLLVVAGYYGVSCFGGFSQTTYLTSMLEVYKKLFPDDVVGESKILLGDFIFSDIQSRSGQCSAITGLDILVYKNNFDFEGFLKICKNTTLNQVMEKIMPKLFRILFPNEQQYPEPKQAYNPDFSIAPEQANVVIKL